MESGRKYFQDVTKGSGLPPVAGQATSFIAHYNLAMNKCFVLISFQSIKEGGETTTISDALEGGEYAAFGASPIAIEKGGGERIWECEEGSSVQPIAKCNSRDQWNHIVAKYMGREE